MAIATLTTTVTDEISVSSNQTSIIVLLTNDTFNPLTHTITQAIIDGITSAGIEANGWNIRVRNELQLASVTRVTEGILRIDLPSFPAYAITANETITVTIPAIAVDSGVAVIASPTFTVTDVVAVGGSLINTHATLGPASNYIIDDHSGFKIPTSDKTFEKDGYGLYSSGKYKDAKHPQDLLRSRSDTFKGSRSPEPDNEFSTSTAEDL